MRSSVAEKLLKLILCISLVIAGVVYCSEIGDSPDNTTEKLNQVRTQPEVDDFQCPENYSCYRCPNIDCDKLGGYCIRCDYQANCTYGQDTTVTCHAEPFVTCKGEREFNRTFNCRYCYQTETWQYKCVSGRDCRVTQAPRVYTLANCTVNNNVLCMGRRRFYKNRLCNWTEGHRWTTALALSITLGGFGADRFYLGQFGEGLGKLLSFGGLGVWTLVDVILVATGYLGPSGGAHYI